MHRPDLAREFHQQSLTDPDAFWRQQAGLVRWQRPFDHVCDLSPPPFARWFVGGETNLCFKVVDRHLAGRGEQAAIVFVSTETGEKRTLTYRELFREVNAFAAILQDLGLGRGDPVILYLPMIPEALIAMLACVRIGAMHSMVFAGFAAGSLATRIDDAGTKPRPRV